MLSVTPHLPEKKFTFPAFAPTRATMTISPSCSIVFVIPTIPVDPNKGYLPLDSFTVVRPEDIDMHKSDNGNW